MKRAAKGKAMKARKRSPEDAVAWLNSSEGRKAMQLSIFNNKRKALEYAKRRDATIRMKAKRWSSTVKCAATGKPLPHSHFSDYPSDLPACDTFQGQERMGGEAFVITCGYGSNHDMSMVLLALSNEVIDRALKNGWARIIGERW